MISFLTRPNLAALSCGSDLHKSTGVAQQLLIGATLGVNLAFRSHVSRP